MAKWFLMVCPKGYFYVSATVLGRWRNLYHHHSQTLAATSLSLVNIHNTYDIPGEPSEWGSQKADEATKVV